MDWAELDTKVAVDVQPSHKLDVPTRLQMHTNDLCGQYSSVLGTLLNKAESEINEPSLLEAAQELGQQIVVAHSGMEALIDELAGGYRTEAQQLQRISELEEEHKTVTEELRTQTKEAGALRSRPSLR